MLPVILVVYVVSKINSITTTPVDPQTQLAQILHSIVIVQNQQSLIQPVANTQISLYSGDLYDKSPEEIHSIVAGLTVNQVTLRLALYPHADAEVVTPTTSVEPNNTKGGSILEGASTSAANAPISDSSVATLYTLEELQRSTDTLVRNQNTLNDLFLADANKDSATAAKAKAYILQTKVTTDEATLTKVTATNSELIKLIELITVTVGFIFISNFLVIRMRRLLAD